MATWPDKDASPEPALGGRKGAPGHPEFKSQPVAKDQTSPSRADLVAVSDRAATSLSSLYAAIEQVTSGVSDAKAANEALVRELGRVRDMLGGTNDRGAALDDQVEQLARELETVRAEAAAERQHLIDEQDRFIAALLEEHEEQLEALQKRLQEAAGQPASTDEQPASTDEGTKNRRRTAPDGVAATADNSARQKLASLTRELEKMKREQQRSRQMLRQLQAQRDEAQTSVAKLTEQRDEARREASRAILQLDNLRAGRRAPAVGSEEDARRTSPAGIDLDHAIVSSAAAAAGRRTVPQGSSPPQKAPSDSETARRTDPQGGAARRSTADDGSFGASGPTPARQGKATQRVGDPPVAAQPLEPAFGRFNPGGAQPRAAATLAGVTSDPADYLPPAKRKPVKSGGPPRELTPPPQLGAALEPAANGRPPSLELDMPGNPSPPAVAKAQPPAVDPALLDWELPPDKKPPLKRKPDPTTRPLGGYSVGSDQLEPEEVEVAHPRSSKPPEP